MTAMLQYREALIQTNDPVGTPGLLPGQQIYHKYQQDPVGFTRDILGTEITDDVSTMMESVRDNIYTIAKSANATGKTHAAAHLALWWWACYPQSQVYTAAAPPEANLKRLLWGEIGKITRRKEEMFRNYRILQTMLVERNPSEFIVGVSIPTQGTDAEREARFSGKHAPNLMFIVDEGDAVPESVYRGIESCMSGGNVRMLIMFNPRAKAGPVFRMERNREAHVVEMSAFNHPNVTSGEDLIPGAVTRAVTVRRIHEWTRPLIEGESESELTFRVPDFLVGETALLKDGTLSPPLLPGPRKIVNPEFAYMVLARYPAAGPRQLVSDEDVARARARYDVYTAIHGEFPPVGAKGILGCDIAEFGTDFNSVCRRFGGLVLPFTQWAGVDVIVSGDKIADIFLDNMPQFSNVYIDATGIGSGTAPQVWRRFRTAGVKRGFVAPIKVAEKPTKKPVDMITGEFAMLKDQMAWDVREWLRTDPGAMLPPDENLIEELSSISYEVTNKGQIKIDNKQTLRGKLGRSSDNFDALCLTFAPARSKVIVKMA